MKSLDLDNAQKLARILLFHSKIFTFWLFLFAAFSLFLLIYFRVPLLFYIIYFAVGVIFVIIQKIIGPLEDISLLEVTTLNRIKAVLVALMEVYISILAVYLPYSFFTLSLKITFLALASIFLFNLIYFIFQEKQASKDLWRCE